ncbi:MAG: Outer membrane protein assembly factor BamA [Chroococcopsis gigantea SAG 12.99]|jgi:hemolysin activation/secretion protein|nr:ShlB/FhaC/HecB family hemolysin secretion/activation protein [Chlorogloea purpurea SAG 13.99]MDV3001606.1 Outer membrane protein assembly factor BamA [Chroococcopsis gigantea SAG 12.99]
MTVIKLLRLILVISAIFVNFFPSVTGAEERRNYDFSDPSFLPPFSDRSDETTFLVKKIEVSGNTVLNNEIGLLVSPYVNKYLSFEDLINLRTSITQVYINKGYVTSGAFIVNNQDLSQGIIKIQVVEGDIERIDLTGLQRLNQGYIRSRLQLGIQRPLNVNNLQSALQLLQLDPLVENINAELTAGTAPGRNVLLVTVKEAPAFHAGIGFDNYRPPSIGSEEGTIFIDHDNLLGFGDRFNGQYAIASGLNTYNVGYSIPINPNNGTVSISYDNGVTAITQARFREFNITSESETLSFAFRQPIIRKPTEEFALGLTLDLRHSQTYLDGEPFSFSGETDDGAARITVIRFSQDWVKRQPTSVIALRSQFSFGVGSLGATITDLGVDGRFFSWIGQFQWVQQLYPGAILLMKLDTQLTPDRLLSMEQFSIGGIDTVRGYPQNQIVTDNGVIVSLEARFPLTSNPDTLQITPFLEAGTGWNNSSFNPDPSTIAGTGIGLRWLITAGLQVRLDYGIPLLPFKRQGDSFQENGFYFSIRYQPF